MSSWDVIVVGLGGVGSAAAFHLAESGQRVLGIDRYPPVHRYGSSHGVNRIIRQAYFEHPSYVPLLRRAYGLWDDLQSRTGQPLFHRTGLVEIGPDDGIVIPGIRQSASEHGLDVEEITPDEMRRRWPGIFAADDSSVVIENNAGYLRVEDCVAAHLECARAASATLRHGEEVVSWKASGAGIEVTTDRATEFATRLVIAGGPWSNQLVSDLRIPIRLLRKHQYWFDPYAHDGSKSCYDEVAGCPCFFHETPTGFYYGFPSTDHRGVKVARHSGGQPVDQPSATHANDAKDRSLVKQYCGKYLPRLGSRIIAQAGCYYSQTPDEHFIVDRHPEHNQVVLVAGLSGHGFKFTSVLGELACQLAIDAPMSLDTALLRIERKMAAP